MDTCLTCGRGTAEPVNQTQSCQFKRNMILHVVKEVNYGKNKIMDLFQNPHYWKILYLLNMQSNFVHFPSYIDNCNNKGHLMSIYSYQSSKVLFISNLSQMLQKNLQSIHYYYNIHLRYQNRDT